MLFFNTAGPINREDHYCIDPLSRLDKQEFFSLIEQKKYFAVHAPRQSGKTSYLIALARQINEKGVYKCLYINVESVYSAREDSTEIIRCILSELASRARDYLNDTFPEQYAFKILAEKGPSLALNELLTLWSKNSAKPLILFLDEIDILKGEVLGSILRQLRAGHDKRPSLFPQSIVLCGVEDIRNKKVSNSPGNYTTAGSIFNIEAKSLRLTNFNRADIEDLFAQFQKDTKIDIEQQALEQIWKLTDGQPWLVNAIAYEICFEMIPRKQDIKTIRLKEVEEAAENLIQRREIHVRNLMEKLNEERIKNIITPMLSGADFFSGFTEDDISYAQDLGLIKIDAGKILIANELYKEIIPRSLIYTTQLLIRYNLDNYLDENGGLNIDKILKAFQIFYNRYYERWVEHFNYKNAGAFLLFQAFLQRITDGGGKIQREYGIGNKSTTIILNWPSRQFRQKCIFDLCLLSMPVKENIKESSEYLYQKMKENGIKRGYLLLFNIQPDSLWEQKLFKTSRDGYTLDIWLI
jgi:hypothetical protein